MLRPQPSSSFSMRLGESNTRSSGFPIRCDTWNIHSLRCQAWSTACPSLKRKPRFTSPKHAFLLQLESHSGRHELKVRNVQCIVTPLRSVLTMMPISFRPNTKNMTECIRPMSWIGTAS
jgi:hypothetical protein